MSDSTDDLYDPPSPRSKPRPDVPLLTSVTQDEPSNQPFVTDSGAAEVDSARDITSSTSIPQGQPPNRPSETGSQEVEINRSPELLGHPGPRAKGSSQHYNKSHIHRRASSPHGAKGSVVFESLLRPIRSAPEGQHERDAIEGNPEPVQAPRRSSIIHNLEPLRLVHSIRDTMRDLIRNPKDEVSGKDGGDHDHDAQSLEISDEEKKELQRMWESGYENQQYEDKMEEAKKQSEKVTKEANTENFDDATNLQRAVDESNQLARSDWLTQAVGPSSIPQLESPEFVSPYTIPHTKKDVYTLWLDVWKDYKPEIKHGLKKELEDLKKKREDRRKENPPSELSLKESSRLDYLQLTLNLPSALRKLDTKKKFRAFFLLLTLPWIRPLKHFFFIGHYICARKGIIGSVPPGPHVVVGWFPRNGSEPIERYVPFTREIWKGSIYDSVLARQRAMKASGVSDASGKWNSDLPVKISTRDELFYVRETYIPNQVELEIKVFQELEGEEIFWALRKGIWAIRGWRQWFTLSNLSWFGLYECLPDFVDEDCHIRLYKGLANNDSPGEEDALRAREVRSNMNKNYLRRLFYHYSTSWWQGREEKAALGSGWRDWINKELSNNMPASGPRSELLRVENSQVVETSLSTSPANREISTTREEQSRPHHNTSLPATAEPPSRIGGVRHLSIELGYEWSAMRIAILISTPLITSLLVGVLYAHSGKVDIITAWTISIYIVTCALVVGALLTIVTVLM